MQLKQTLLIIIVFCMAAAAAAFGETTETSKQLTLQGADSLSALEVDCGSGFLKLEGVDGLKEIEVNATIIVKGIDDAKTKDYVGDYVKLTLSKKGSKAVLVSKIKSGIFSSIFRSGHAVINLEVRVPKKFALDIDDGSGFIEISNVNGNVELDDGSGSIKCEDVGGTVKIDDGSGSIQLENIGGDIDIEDGSGSIQVSKAGGDVNLDDSSGGISVYDTKGSVTVDDGSGGILIDGVKKDVDIKRAGSGSVTIRNVEGKIRR
ncbi:MAG: DUF4097 domain-containing protein [bacterium]|nr:DUF4097 domain-containing protein [bacterium]